MRAHIREKLEAIIEDAANELNALRKAKIDRKKRDEYLEGYKSRRLAVIFYMKMKGFSIDEISNHVGLKPSEVMRNIQAGAFLYESFDYWKNEWQNKYKLNEH